MKPRVVSGWPTGIWWVRLRLDGCDRWACAVSWPDALGLVADWYRARSTAAAIVTAWTDGDR